MPWSQKSALRSAIVLWGRPKSGRAVRSETGGRKKEERCLEGNCIVKEGRRSIGRSAGGTGAVNLAARAAKRGGVGTAFRSFPFHHSIPPLSFSSRPSSNCCRRRPKGCKKIGALSALCSPPACAGWCAASPLAGLRSSSRQKEFNMKLGRLLFRGRPQTEY